MKTIIEAEAMSHQDEEKKYKRVDWRLGLKKPGKTGSSVSQASESTMSSTSVDSSLVELSSSTNHYFDASGCTEFQEEEQISHLDASLSEANHLQVISINVQEMHGAGLSQQGTAGVPLPVSISESSKTNHHIEVLRSTQADLKVRSKVDSESTQEVEEPTSSSIQPLDVNEEPLNDAKHPSTASKEHETQTIKETRQTDSAEEAMGDTSDVDDSYEVSSEYEGELMKLRQEIKIKSRGNG